MGRATRAGWVLGATLTLGCQAESPVVGESTEGVASNSGLDEYSGAGTNMTVLERVYGDTCIPYDLSFDEITGMVPCMVVETSLEAAPEACDCSPALGRGPSSPELEDVVRRELENAGECNAADTPACEDLCMCEIFQASDLPQEACETESEHSGTQGYCIVDPAQGRGDPALVSDCPLSRKKLLRLGMTEPSPNTALHLLCIPKAEDRQHIRGLGEPCLPGIERDPSFPGFTLGTVNVEAQAPGCATDVCLVHNFQGRVSCPYGQTEEQALEAPACFLPGTDVPVQTDVASQLVARPPELASICSCRCDGPDTMAPYCECPESMECAPLIDDVGLGAGLISGSFCVPRGSLITETGQDGPACDAAEENCGSASP